MIFRYLMQRLANNEKLVDYLSQSYVIRRAAQLTVSAFYRSKQFAADNKLNEMTPERFRSLMQSFKSHLEKEIEAAKRELKNGSKK